MLSHKTEIRVRYADTDQMQFVYNGKYLEYFEVGRTEMMRAHGLPYYKMEQEGYQLPLLEAHVKYISHALYDDLLEVEAFVPAFPEFRIRIEYKVIRKGSGELVAEGYTEHVFIKKDTKKPVRPPKFFSDVLKPLYSEIR